MKKEKIAIFVVTHKKINTKNYPGRKFIYVGQNSFEIDNITFFKDNIADNISTKNPFFCELTALYWIWKNYPNVEYVGIEHYRRCYYKGFRIAPIDYLYDKAKTVDFLHYQTYYHPFWSEKYRWGKYDGKTMHDVLRASLTRKYPQYLDEFDHQMKRWSCVYCNMFICKKELFDKYMNFLFDILFDAEKHINDVTPNERPRCIGYMAERLFNTFLSFNKYSHKSQKVLKTKRWIIK